MASSNLRALPWVIRVRKLNNAFQEFESWRFRIKGMGNPLSFWQKKSWVYLYERIRDCFFMDSEIIKRNLIWERKFSRKNG